MTIIVENVHLPVTVSLSILKFTGFWAPEGLNFYQALMYKCYAGLVFMLVLGIYIMIQVVDLYMIWGDVPLMTGSAFLLFTNLSHAFKIVNILWKKHMIRALITDCDDILTEEQRKEGVVIVKSYNRQSLVLQMTYFALAYITVTGWATGAEENQLPMRAWYPYNTSKSPAFELTYVHQIAAMYLAATLNVAKDTLVVAVIGQCRCRLKLLGLSLRTLCRDLEISRKLTPQQEATVNSRLRDCVLHHQAALEAILQVEKCFSAPTFGQFTVSLVIFCVSAFQMVLLKGNVALLLPMATYLVCMMFQVFIYCYQGHHLSEESAEVAGAAYDCPWYTFPIVLRRNILIVMSRTRRMATLTAAGFTTLSLGTFMAMIKVSYSLFTLLKQVSE